MSRIRSHLVRAVLAFLALPGVVAFAVPILVAWPIDLESVRLAGLIPLLAGVALLVWCVRDFYVAGQGTLAPWDPPRNLVVAGPYRVSRNPMYVAVMLVLAGWAITLRSTALLVYALVAFLVFHLWVVFGEESWLMRGHRERFTRYAARVPRWVFRSRRALVLSTAALVVALPLAGLIYEAYVEGRATREFPPPGMLVDIGGRRLHLVCLGEGEPTVMFEASGFGVSSVSSAIVRERVARRARVCSYDRIGMGWSDPGPGVLTAGELARQLAVLQDHAHLEAPFVLVGSSVGGLVIEMFARKYPERAAGLVFLDAASSGVLPHAERWFGAARAAALVGPAAARVGLIRWLDPFRIPTDTDDGRRSAAMTYSAAPMASLSAILRGLPASQREFAAAMPLRASMPIAVLTASDPHFLEVRGFDGFTEGLSPTRIETHQQLAKQSEQGSWRMVPKSTHLIASSQPDAVVEVILAMIEGLR